MKRDPYDRQIDDFRKKVLEKFREENIGDTSGSTEEIGGRLTLSWKSCM
jgi:hypothetical protein